MSWFTSPDSMIFFGGLCLTIMVAATGLVASIGMAARNGERRFRHKVN